MLADDEVRCLLDFPGIANKIDKLLVIENGHRDISIEVHELLASDLMPIIFIINSKILAPFIESVKAEVLLSSANGETARFTSTQLS